MRQAAKRRKVKSERYPCHTCLVDRTTKCFPNYNPTEKCSHLINTCTKCLKQWVESQIESKAFTPQIKCPQCDETMNGRDLQMAVTKKVFARYVELERRYIAEHTPGWRWCLSPKCSAGHVHVSSADDPDSEGNPIDISERKAPSWASAYTSSIRTAADAHKRLEATESEFVSQPTYKPDIFICNDCGAKACVPCDRPWHDEETCEEYQTRIKDKIKEEDASLAAIQKSTKKCPQCSKSIEKDGGCTHMTCTQCWNEFCWNCEHLINQNGQWCGCRRMPNF